MLITWGRCDADKRSWYKHALENTLIFVDEEMIRMYDKK